MEGKFIQFFSLICLCLFPAISTLEANDVKANKGCIEIERKALIKFKEGLTDPSHFLSSWTGDNCCSWKGISCSNETGHVVKIELQNYECFNDAGNYYGSNQNASCLGGQISTSLLDLKYLDHLDLSLNSFQIPIPEFLGSLGMLSYLNLSLAAFTGMIPQHLGNLSNLRYLDLSSDSSLQSNDLYWLSSLTSLEYLKMGSVNLSLASTHWLQVLNLIPSLSEVHLVSCELQNLPQSLHTVNFTSLSVLELTGNRFKSPIPRWFSNLSTLVQLDLTMSEITGDVSAVIGDLTTCCKNSLEELILAGNQISGHIPHSLGLLKKLKFLELFLNFISGPIPETVGNLTNLEVLDLSYNQMNGSLPESIKMLTKLASLDLLQNSWQGILSENQLQSLGKLEYFTISSSNKSFTINVSYNWVPPFSLKDIEINDCLLGPKFPAWLKTQKQLSTVILTNVGISEVISDWLWGLSQLTWCDLSNNQITGSFLPSLEYPSPALQKSTFNRSKSSFTSWHKLYNLNLAGNLLSGPIPANIGQVLASVSMLNLSWNFLDGRMPSSIGRMRNLISLDLSNNQLSGRILDNSRHLKKLLVLDLSANHLSGTVPGSIFLLPELQKLKLNDNHLSGDLSNYQINNASFLELLDLGGNRFAGKIPKWLGASPLALFELRLRANRFSGSIPEEVCNLIYLHILDIAANYLSGSIPACLGQLTHMQIVLPFVPISPISAFKDIAEMDLVVKGRQMRYGKTLELVNILDLSSNNLSGEIPKEITRLLALGTLNLSRNQLTANIPEEIGNLSLLETLDLSHNHLSGPIPRSMTAMTFLNYLNLSYNNLSGQIPSTNQFQTFNDPSIYEGNAGLCGVPLPTKCDAVNAGDAEDKGRMKDHSVEEDGEDSTKLEFYISMVLGFIFGFWGVFGSLYVYKPWRQG
ncbi:receptor-like protein EIX2 [Coffea arabica]|uniref:Receptor-like protein EIX2 n=1 Tax=Coffea arabica TaxID=13443 RepID=A0ABM4U5G7_COFAR|nr:receptor-like protein EIX2 [Coffea arabica]